MTKDEWKKVDEALAGMFGSVEMLVDGYKVSLYKRQVGKTKLRIMTYVNGHFRGSWESGDPEAKYLRLVNKYLYPLKIRKDMEKIYGKRLWKKEAKSKYERQYSYYSPFWLSVSGIRRLYEKTFKDIKLVKINGETVS